MASNEDTSKQVITPVPERLLGFIRTRVASYLSEGNNFSTDIYQVDGQAARLVIKARGKEHDAKTEDEVLSVDNLHADQTNYASIIVGNIPPTVNEEVIEVFFESKKKGAGAHVKHVLLNRTKHWAVVEFEEPEAVSTIMRKLPISLMDFELSVQPYQPIIADGCEIHDLEIRDLPDELTEELLAKDIDETLGLVENSSAENDPEVEESMNEYSGTEYIEDIIPVKLRMLDAKEYTSTVSERFPGVKFIINLENNKICISGKTEDLVSSKLDLYMTLSSFCVYNVECISPELYRYTKVKGYINDKLVKNELICSWEVRNERLFMCSQEVDIARCTDLVLGSVKEVIFPICFESASIFLSSQWHDFLTKLQAESAVICNAVSSGNGTEVHVITTDDVIDYIVKKIKTFLKGMLKITTETFKLL